MTDAAAESDDTEEGEHDREELLERTKRALQTMQAIHNDSRTPLEDAIALMPHIRKLTDLRRALRREAYQTAAASEKFQGAILALTKVNLAIKADVIRHKRFMEFISNAATATSAVLDFAIAVGAAAK